MKKAFFLIITVLLIFSCDESRESPYTNVEYNGNSVTIHLKGVGVPVTKAHRALTKHNAQSVHDYFEVAFKDTTASNIVRASWRLGESAVISGVVPGDYNTSDKAILFVGRRSGNNNYLLGLGLVTEVDGTPGTEIKADSKTVTFSVAALGGGLHIPGGVTVYDDDAIPNEIDIIDDDEKIGNRIYPRFHLDNIVTGSKYTLTYKLSMDIEGGYESMDDYIDGIAITGINADEGAVFNQIPNFSNAVYDILYSINKPLEIKLLNNFDPAAAAPDNLFNPEIEIEITTDDTINGVFSISFSIPVTPILKNSESNIWLIQSGFGSFNNSVDDGNGSLSGAILFSTGNDPDDYNNLN